MNQKEMLNILRVNYNLFIATAILLFVIYLMYTSVTKELGFLMIPVFFLMLIGKFFIYRHDTMPAKEAKKVFKNMRKMIEKDRDKFEKIELYTIDNIGKKYEALGMVESSEVNKEDGRLALQVQAFRLGADAIVNIVSSVGSNTEGNIRADTILSPGGGGSIRTSAMYYYEGTAVKYI